MTPYQIAWQKKRTRNSFLAAFLLHLLIFSGIILYGLLFRVNLDEFSGPVLIKLGEPEGVDLPLPPELAEILEPEKEPQQERTDAVEEAPVVEDTSVPEEVPAVLPEIREQRDQVLPAEAPEPSPVTPVAPERTVEESREPEPVVIKGSDAGNAYEFQYSAENGQVGRSLGVDISRYMPLPNPISFEQFNRISGESYLIGVSRQKIVLRYYKEFNNLYYMEKKPPFSDVTAIWEYLIDAGYDYIHADYKKDFLRPVVLEFELSPESELLDVSIKSSSGDLEIDQAVKEGFINASFRNSADRKIKGRFTYSFN